MATHNAQEHELDMKQVMLVVDSESKIMIAQEYAFDPRVRAAIQRVQKQSKDRFYEVIPATMEEILARSNDVASDSEAVVRSQSEMERAAYELFHKAVEAKASDIHVRVKASGRTEIFFRVHNDLRVVGQHPATWGQALCSAIYHALADVADATYDESSRQDARIAGNRDLPQELDGIRIATTPMVDGNVMVMRLLYDTAGESDDICDLGFTETQKAQVQILKQKPTGIIVIAGPTGSGKSTTLQRSLKSLIRETEGKKHVITVEDPPEYKIAGAVQTPVANAATELERSVAFQSAIKGAMRLDPDIIMIGEMRDSPSAKLAIQAAMTGHQVWSTLHANGPFHVVSRLLDMGIEINTLTDHTILSGMLSQRLLKRLCDCKKPFLHAWDEYKKTRPSAKEDYDRIASVVDLGSVYLKGDGCGKCAGTGISGRTVVAEVVVTDRKMMEHLRRLDLTAAMNYWRTDLDGLSMIGHAIQKVEQGIVDPFQTEEVVGFLDGELTASRTQLLRAV
jgi:type II secretory ATPase GspE/PulE/Tfp pilus assembly ATPase PilB-like protein